MNNLQMLKKAMLAYVSAVKFIWSEIAYPLIIVGKKLMNLRGYKVYGNSIQDGTPTPDNPVEIESVGDLSTKNLFDKTKVDRMVTIVEGTDDIIVTDSGNIFLNHVNTIAMLKPSTTYTISFDIEVFYVPDDTIWKLNTGSGGWFGVLLYSSVNNAIRMIASGIKEPVKVGDKYHVYRVFTTPDTLHEEDANFFMYSYGGNYVKIDGTYGYASGKSKFSNFQIREGEYTQTEMDEYEPYNKYKIPVVARGKNMATAQQVYSNASDYSECTEDGRNCIRCTSDGKSYAGINFKTNTQYTVRFEAKTVAKSSFEGDTSGEALFAFTHTDGTRKLIVVYGSKDWKYYEATSLANKTIASVGMYAYNYKHWIYVNVDTFQIEEGTTATAFEPYIAPVTTNIFLNEPLRKVGDYADYIDFEKQKVVRNVEVLDDTGTKTIDESLGVINPPTEETVNLPALPQFKGTTIYEVGTNIKPSGMEAKYC